MMLIDMVSVAIHASGFIVLFYATGTALFLAMFDNPDPAHAQVMDSIRHTAQRSAWAGILLLLMHQGLAGARMMGEWTGITDWSMQWRALQNSAGAASSLRIAGLCLLAMNLRSRDVRGMAAATTGSLVVIASFVLTGHTATQPLRWLLAPLLMLHLWIVAFWFGGLWPLYLVTNTDSRYAATLIARFSITAGRLVPCIAVTGIWMAYLLLPGPQTLLEPYGLLLLGKAGGFVLLMGLAAWNKWRLGPAIAAGSQSAAVTFRRSVLSEFVLLCLVLIIAAVMTGWFSPE